MEPCKSAPKNARSDAIVREIHEKSRRTLKPLPTQISPALDVIRGVKAVIFDIYGTLLVSGSGDVGTALASSRKEAFRNALVSAGIPKPEAKMVNAAEKQFFSEIHARHAASHENGMRYPEVDVLSVWTSVFQALSLDLTEPSCIAAAITYEVTANPVFLMPGAVATLRELRQSGIRLGIVSNAQFYTRPLLEYELGNTLEGVGFDLSLCSYSYCVGEAKPSSAIFHPVIQRLSDTYGIQPSKAIYIGNDMLNDVYAASKMNLVTCLFAGDSRSLRLREAENLDVKPDLVATELSQIITVVSP
jgi:putative hydrolase of the HAD superfamily